MDELKTGCCESRTTGYCMFYPGGFSTHKGTAYTDAFTTDCVYTASGTWRKIALLVCTQHLSVLG